eukprot:TRINITY_DN7769_c2_g1_i1.p3 TRINITY_DN7769_c2_g1~~TRINITY_DN7769_c2_g1_i1.p3  ORF type:complete len:103 (-),score=3.73 TRINITY_DN7769_c2_g1_i1:187-495(-)
MCKISHKLAKTPANAKIKSRYKKTAKFNHAKSKCITVNKNDQQIQRKYKTLQQCTKKFDMDLEQPAKLYRIKFQTRKKAGDNYKITLFFIFFFHVYLEEVCW